MSNQTIPIKLGTPMLSTKDNPFNPFEDFSNWLIFDEQKSHQCSETLARIARTSDQLTDEENRFEIEKAIDEIIKVDIFDKFIKVFP